MRLIRPLIVVTLVAAVAPAGAESLPVSVVQNDGYLGGPATFPTSFQTGDIIAVRLDVPSFGSFLGVELLFGGTLAPGPHPVTIKVWDDTAGTLEPGPELLSTDESLVASESLQSLFLSSIGVPDRIRVGIVLRATSPPMIGHDTDGTIAADRNFTFRAGDGWRPPPAGGATGDWILRAMFVGGGGVGGGGGSDGGVGSGGACFGVDCPAGQFCDTAARSCTFECVSRADCGGALCNANGQCVGEGAGCCQAGGGRGGAAAGLALGVLAAVLRRRRRR